MPLVINEFEVIAEPPAAQTPTRGTSGEQPASETATASVAAISPHEIERVLRRSAERLARIWAH